MAVCVHGLTRTGRDFDALASHLLEEGWASACPDIVGRGLSDWLSEASDYGLPQYVSDMVALLARLDVEEVDWIGTSMGGLLGLLLAAQPGTPIRRLVLNDVGPFVPSEALDAIAGYLGHVGPWADIAEAEQVLRRVHSGFGPLDDDQWRHIAETSTRRSEDGQLRFHYDPSIAQAFTDPLQDIDLWPQWKRISRPTLVLRGEESSLLTAETLRQMEKSGPQAESVTISGCGHAPSLMDRSQMEIISEWLGR
ncbi:alpha/beta fold hydrolase [Fodinicurvata halophila]|uniref:Alpha/beta fold hydrolase n=1 Tax=Fodinicurvata halophila TaxID=1419723 RepID=A0ABV8UKP7_9PROT